MVKNNRGWYKLYLFYGTIFFLLGLFGYLFSSESMINYLEEYRGHSAQYIQDIKDYSLARDFGLTSEDEAISAIAKQFSPFILYAYPVDLKSNHPALVKEIELNMLANFNKIKIVALPSHENWETRLQKLLSQFIIAQTDTVLIGLDLLKTTNKCHSYKMTLILPDFLANTLTSQIVFSFTELFPSVTFQNRSLKTWRILDFTWEEARGHAEADYPSSGPLKATDLLIQTLQQNLSGNIKI